MRKLVAAIVVAVLSGGGLVMGGCDKDKDICDEAEDVCVECSDNPSECRSVIDACRVLPDVPLTGRDYCCEQEKNQIEALCP